MQAYHYDKGIDFESCKDCRLPYSWPKLHKQCIDKLEYNCTIWIWYNSLALLNQF
jgi:hypothetical protein